MGQETAEQLQARLYGGVQPTPIPVDNENAQGRSESSPANQDDDAVREEIRRDEELYRILRNEDKFEAEQGQGILNKAAQGVVENAPELIGGHYAGKALRKVIPQDIQYDPSLEQVRKTTLPNAYSSQESLRNDVIEDINQRNFERESHIDKTMELEREARMREHEAKLIEHQLEEARKAHAAAQLLEPEHFLPEGQQKPVAEPAREVELTKKPLGGSGTAEYAQKFGATPEEAQRVPSMSAMQKQNIPAQAQALEKISGLSPNVVMTAESPLLLTPEAQEAVKEREQLKAQEAEREHAEKQLHEHEHKKAIKRVAHEKFTSEQKVKEMERQHAAKLKEVAEARREHREHSRVTPHEGKPTVGQSNEMRKQQDLINELESRIRAQYPNADVGKILAKFGMKVLPRFVPSAGAAFAPLEAEKAKEEWEKGNRGRAAVYGLGALGAAAQATNIPWAMGLGDIAQMPSIGLGLYDLGKKETPP